jgi:hypothetical protein
MKQLRRFRVLFAVFAIVFSPGGATPWLQLAHACGPSPAEHSMDGMDHTAMAGHAGHQMPDAGESDGPKHLQHCICVGACASAAMAATNGSTTIAVIPAEFRAPAARPQVAVVPSAPQYAHPFAHAPPLA